MKAIKKITEVILTIIASIALLMMTAEAETIGMQAICTLGSIAVLLAAANSSRRSTQTYSRRKRYESQV